MKISPKQLLTLLNIARDAAMKMKEEERVAGYSRETVTKLIEEVENQQSDDVVEVGAATQQTN